MSLPTNELSITWAAIVVSACGLWGYLGIRVLIAVLNPRDTERWLYRLSHRICAASEAYSAFLDAHDNYKARNAQAWARPPEDKA